MYQRSIVRELFRRLLHSHQDFKHRGLSFREYFTSEEGTCPDRETCQRVVELARGVLVGAAILDAVPGDRIAIFTDVMLPLFSGPRWTNTRSSGAASWMVS